MSWCVTYDNGGYVHHWNCEDSEVESIRVFEYFKGIFKHVCRILNGDVVEEYTDHDEF